VGEECAAWCRTSRARIELARESNAIQRYLTYLRNSRLFIVGASQGEIDIHLFGLLLACDVRIASDDSAVVNRGYAQGRNPGTGVPWFLTRIMGETQAMNMLLHRDTLSARRAYETGIIHHITRAESHERDSLTIAQAIAGQGVQHLLSLKRSLAESFVPLDKYLEVEGARAERLRIGAPSCDGCGYNLTGNVSGRCPECGKVVDDLANGWPGGFDRQMVAHRNPMSLT
jgi:enoyl-CoA hydratase/carnithine racemase